MHTARSMHSVVARLQPHVPRTFKCQHPHVSPSPRAPLPHVPESPRAPTPTCAQSVRCQTFSNRSCSPLPVGTPPEVVFASRHPLCIDLSLSQLRQRATNRKVQRAGVRNGRQGGHHEVPKGLASTLFVITFYAGTGGASAWVKFKSALSVDVPFAT